MAEALVNDPRKKLYSALVSSPDKDLAGQVKKFSYNKFNSLLDNTDFVEDLFLDISERGVVLDPKNPRSSQDPNEFISAFVQKEIPQAPPAPKPQPIPVAPAPVEEEPYIPEPQPLVGSREYDAQLQAQYGGMSPTLGATFGGAPAAFETKAQKKQEQISPAFKAQQLAFEDVPIAEEQRRAQRQFAKSMKEQQQIEQQQPKGFFEDLGKQVKRGLAQGRAVQSVNMEQLRDAARGKNLEAIPYEQIAAANKAVKEFGQTQSDIDLATKEGIIKDAWDVVKALPGVTIESLSSLGRSGLEEALVGAGTGAAAGSVIPGLGTAAGGGLGAAAGMVQAGRNLEYFGTLMQELEAKGVDITDPAKLKYGIATYGKDADKTAITRANTIAAVESLLPIAGRGAEALATRVGSKVAQKPLQAVGKALTYEPVAGPLGGATGELAAQIASGQEIDPQAIALETGGEGAATVAAIAKAIKSRKKPSAQPAIAPEAEAVTAEELQGPGFQIAYAKTREEIPQEYRGTIAEIERPTTRLGRFGPMERLFAYRVPAETIDITAPEAVAEEDIAEEVPFEEVPSEEVVVPPQEEDEDLAAFGRELEAIEQAAPVAPAEEAPAIAPLNIDFTKNEGRNVNYQGVEGRVKIDSDGAPYVFTKDGDVVYIEGGLSGQTPQQLGVQPLADDVINEADVETVLQDENAPLDQNQLEYDFDNNTVTLYGKPFTYEGVETNSKGQTTALRLRDANGRVKFVRNEDTILEFEIQKELYEKSRTNKPATIESATAAAQQLQVVPVARIEQVPESIQQEGPVGDIESDEVAPAEEEVVTEEVPAEPVTETPQEGSVDVGGEVDLGGGIKNKVTDKGTNVLPIAEIDNLRSQKQTDLATGNAVSLENDLSKNGIKEPLVITYYPNEGKAVLTDGHNRLDVAKDMGAEKLPIRIVEKYTDAPNNAKDWTPPKAVEQSLKETPQAEAPAAPVTPAPAAPKKEEAPRPEPTAKKIDKKSVQASLDKAKDEYEKVKGAFDKKRSELDKTTREDVKDLFGERKVEMKAQGLFEMPRISPGQREKAIQPFRDRMNKAKEEVNRLTKMLEEGEEVSQKISFNKAVEEIKSKPLSHVFGIKMGSNQAEGTYISTEKENRYAKSAPNSKISKAEVSIENPLVVTDDIGLVDLRNKILNRNLVEFTEEDFELYEIPDEPTVDDLNDSGVAKLSKLVTKDLKTKGYDSIYFPESKMQEGELIVFDRKNVKFTEYEQVQGAGKETRKAEGAPKAKRTVRPKTKPVRNAGKSPDAITARTITIYGDPYATSLQYLMDATYHPDLLEAIFGGPSRTTKSGRKDISRERKSRIQFLDKNSPIKTADKLAEILAERYAEENNIDVKDAEQQHDFSSIGTDIISSYASRNQMVREVLRLNEQQNEEFDFMYNPEDIYGEGYNEDIAKEIDGIMDELPDSYWEGKEITDEEFGRLFAEEAEPETKEGKKAEAKEGKGRVPEEPTKKGVRFEKGKKLTEEEKKEVYKNLKDSYKEMKRPYTIETRVSQYTGRDYEARVWLENASDYMQTSDVTGRKLRYYIFLPDGTLAHPTEIFPNISASEMTRVQRNVEYNERQANEKMDDITSQLKKSGEIDKVVKAIETALKNGAEFVKEYDSGDVGQKNPLVMLRFPNGRKWGVPQYVINTQDSILGFTQKDVVKDNLGESREKIFDTNYQPDWEQFYNNNKQAEATPSFTSEQSSEAATAFDKAKTSKGFDKKHGKGAYKALSDITKNFEDIMDKVSEKIKQDCIV